MNELFKCLETAQIGLPNPRVVSADAFQQEHGSRGCGEDE